MNIHGWTKIACLAVAAALLCVGTGVADEKPDPYAKPNNTWISISGTVKSVKPDTFLLDYGEGLITVEMDDGDRDADAYKLLKDDKVTVTGKIDDDFLQTRTIEASSVFVEKLGTYFFASAVDEEDPYYVSVSVPVVVSTTYVRGKVTEIGDHWFKVDTGPRELKVDVDEMPYDPLDNVGYQKIEKGHRVSVSGHMDNELFEGRVLDARSIVTLSTKEERRKSKSSETSTQ